MKVTWKKRKIGFGFEYRRNHIRNSLALERLLTGEHLVENASEREDVAALIGCETFRLFRRHITRGAQDDSGIRRCQADRGRIRRIGANRTFHRLCETEVED